MIFWGKLKFNIFKRITTKSKNITGLTNNTCN